MFRFVTELRLQVKTVFALLLFQVSRRDYPSVLGRDNLNGGTTVSGTLLAAAKIEEHLVR